jgi:hypothetical protein
MIIKVTYSWLIHCSGKFWNKRETVYDSGSSPTALQQDVATHRHVLFVLRYAICIRKHARFLLQFCEGTTTAQQAGAAVKKTNFVRHTSLPNLDRVISCTDPCIHGFPQSRANPGIVHGLGSSFPVYQLSYHLTQDELQCRKIPIAKSITNIAFAIKIE